MSFQVEIVAVAGVFSTSIYLLHAVKEIYLRRLDARRGIAPGFDAVTSERIARIEQAVDAIAVEMERVSEGQRFTTKLLSERASGAAVRDPR